jgi:hypothetical protein
LQGNEDVLNNGLRVTAQAVPQLVITLGSNAGLVEGRVMNGREPVSAATVVLIPESRQRLHVNHKVTATDQAGRFQIPACLPATTNFSPGGCRAFAWQNAEFMRHLESQGKPVHIDEGGRHSVELTSIP